MDGARFDSLARSLTAARSRRAALAAVLSGSLGLLGRTETAAKKGKTQKPCPPCRKRKQGKCKGTQPEGTGCTDGTGRGGTCQRGSCVAAVIPSPGPPPAGCAGLSCGAVCCTPPPGLVVRGISCGLPPSPVCACELRLSDVCAAGCPEQDPFTVDCAHPNLAQIHDVCRAAGCEPPLEVMPPPPG
jgi:hypothetical protein